MSAQVFTAVMMAQGEVRRVLEPLKPGEIVARGWLRRQLELSLSGMGGHLGEIEPDQMAKPYVTRDFDPANGARGLVGWCAEMGAQYTLGAALLAYTLGDDALIAKAAERVRAAMSLQEPDGYLGAYRSGDDRQDDYNAWGCHFFYNAMLLEYYRTGDKAILDAVHRGLLWFARKWSGEKKTDYVGPTIIEPASVVCKMTNDKRLLDFCEEYATWLDRPGRKNGATFTTFPLTNHAYHVAAVAARNKLPAALSFASGKRDYLDAAIKAYRDFHDGVGWQVTYAPCADGEWTAAPSCVGETEYCDFIFYQELFAWFTSLTGDTDYADAVERIVFNAAQGARAKDERTIGYMSSPNQWYATLTSSRWGPEPFFHAYAPNMNPACCPANSIRLYPLYVQNAVFREGCDLRMMNYGPYDVRTKISGRDVRVTSKTEYPFGKRVTLRVRADGWDGALRLRRPAWAEHLRIMRGGKQCQVVESDRVVTVAGPWKADETVVVDFEWRPVVRTVRDRDFANASLRTVEWGALVFAQPVAERWKRVQRPKPGWGEDNSPPQPEAWPWLAAECKKEPMAYALPQDLAPSEIRVKRKRITALPWQNPPVRLSVPMLRASAAYPPEKRDGVHTPIPSNAVVAPDPGAKREMVELVPFGATCLRTTCFPSAGTNLCRYTQRVRDLRRLRGVMLPERDCTEDDFRTLNEWGATLARYQMPREWNTKNGNADIVDYGRYVDGRLDHLEKVLEWARKYGLKIIIDLHAAPGSRIDGDELRMCHETKYADAFIETWRRIAKRFKGRDEVYGYDLVNEPCQNRPSPPGLGFWELQERAARAIRAIDSSTPIIVESNQYASPWDYIERKPIDVENVIYEAHMYSPNAYTHQGVFAPNKSPLSYPGEPGKLDRAHIKFVLSQLRAFQLRYGAKVLIGEFSAVAWAKGAEKYLADCISVFEEYGWDWCYHAFREWSGWSVEHEGPDAQRLVPSADNPRKRALLNGLRLRQ
jgi:hypothetical protein